ncbi:hypothetical protein WEI85_33900 [Actinomycetes bacterium KLBMP 9797]
MLVLTCQLVESGVRKVTVESTSDYWRIWFYLLESQGLDVQLVNARDVKNVPGRPGSPGIAVRGLAVPDGPAGVRATGSDFSWGWRGRSGGPVVGW